MTTRAIISYLVLLSSWFMATAFIPLHLF